MEHRATSRAYTLADALAVIFRHFGNLEQWATQIRHHLCEIRSFVEDGFSVDIEREIREVKRIAAVYASRGRLSLAIQILQTALELQTGLHGPNSLPCAETAYQIAELMCDNNQFDEARPYFERAVNAWQEQHPRDSISMMWYSEALMRLQEQIDIAAIAAEVEEAAAEEEEERKSA